MSKEDKKTVEVMEDSLEALADNIAELSKVGKAIKNSRLSERGIIHMLSGIIPNLYKHQIKTVLDALPELEEKYLKGESK